MDAFHNSSTMVQACSSSSFADASTLSVAYEASQLNLLLSIISNWHPPFATCAAILVNVAIYAYAGITSIDVKWTIIGKRLAAFSFKERVLFKFVPFLRPDLLFVTLKSPRQVINELPFYFASSWIHNTTKHLTFNMLALLYYGSILEEKNGSRFVVLSILCGNLVVSALRTIYLFFIGAAPALHGFKNMYSVQKQITNHFRFGVGFSAILCHLNTLVALESNVDWPSRVFALFLLWTKATVSIVYGKQKHLEPHWGHLVGMASGLLQAGYMAIQTRLKNRKSHRASEVPRNPNKKKQNANYLANDQCRFMQSDTQKLYLTVRAKPPSFTR